MTSFSYLATETIIDSLMKGVESIISSFGLSPLYPPPPTREELKQLLDCTFAASLETEEGRAVAFTIVFFRDREQAFPYQIEPSLSLSARDLVRLAVALDPSRSRICVTSSEAELKIAGLFHLGEQEAFHGTRHTLNNLSIRVLGPAIFLIRYGGQLLFTYQRGRFAFHVGENRRFDEYGVKHALSFRFGSGRTSEQLQADYRFEAAMVRIARTMLRLRHGGSLLVLPEGSDWENATTSKRYAPAKPVTIVKDASIQHLEYHDKRNACAQSLMQGQVNADTLMCFADYMTPARFSYELEWLARLTATDGMTVILPDYTLLGFGVFFNTQEDKGKPTRVLVLDPYDEERQSEPKSLDMLGGARHQSAAVTCRRFPGSLAIVASQDGCLSSMQMDTSTEDVVVVFRHVQLLLDV